MQYNLVSENITHVLIVFFCRLSLPLLANHIAVILYRLACIPVNLWTVRGRRDGKVSPVFPYLLSLPGQNLPH